MTKRMPGTVRRRLGHVRGDHDPPLGVRLKDLLLFGSRGAARRAARFRSAAGAARPERRPRSAFGRGMDVLFGRHEDQHVAASMRRQLVHRRRARVLQIGLRLIVGQGRGPVKNFHRIGAARYFDHRRRRLGRAEVPGETVGVDRGRGDDQLQLGPLGEQALQIAEQKIDVQRGARGPRR